MGGVPRRCAVRLAGAAMNRALINLYAFVTGVALAAALCFSTLAEASTYWRINSGLLQKSGTVTDVAEYLCANVEKYYSSDPVAWANYSSKSFNHNAISGTTPYREAAVYCNWTYYATPQVNQYVATISEVIGTCPTGYHDEAGQCVKDNPCLPGAGQVVSSGMYDLGTDDTVNPPTTTCDGACELSYTGSGIVSRQLVGGVYHYFSEGSYTQTSTQCSTSSALPGSTSLPPPSCDSLTQQQGTVNGKFVCLDKSTTKTTTTAPLVTNPDGSTTQTTTTSDSGTKMDTITTTTTAPDGTVSTSTTTAPTPGTGADSPFCEANPTDPSCTKDDIPWGTVPGPEALGVLNIPVNTSYSVVGGEGSCPADASLDVMGIAVTWSYQPLCSFASTVRPILIAFAWVSFGFIVLGAVRS